MHSAGRWFGAYCRLAVKRQPWPWRARRLGKPLQLGVTPRAMSQSPLDQAFERAERALLRIERSVERGAMHRGRDDTLRGKVAGVVAELDELIRASGARG